MLKVSLSTAFMLYLGFTLVILLFFWLHHNFLQWRKGVSYERNLYVCEYCSHAYLEESEKGVTQCPLCQSFNRES